MKKKRCNFSFETKQLQLDIKVLQYHDKRWCKPVHEDNELFAMLILEGMQAGVSWNLILNKEENFRKAFDGFNPQIVANYGKKKIAELMQNEGIIRNHLKIKAAITNAQAFIKVQQEFGSFNKFIWSFTNNKVVDHHLLDIKDMPAQNELSQQVSSELKKRGFKFVGPTIIYSYLQGIGIINDHWQFCAYR